MKIETWKNYFKKKWKFGKLNLKIGILEIEFKNWNFGN